MKVHPLLILLHGLSHRNAAAGPGVPQNRLRCPPPFHSRLAEGSRRCFHPHASPIPFQVFLVYSLSGLGRPRPASREEVVAGLPLPAPIPV